MYDGTFVKQQPVTLTQRIEGFYDPANVTGRITYIAGSAQSGLGERLTGPFSAQNGLFNGGRGVAWDTVTRTTNSLAGAAFFDTSIAPQYSGVLSILNDCVSMGAMIYRTQVNDTDSDGLLNKWESSTDPILDPRGAALPNLRAMVGGADHQGQQDIFIEIGALYADPGTMYGSEDAPLNTSTDSVTDLTGHVHLPTPEALKLVGDAFAAKGIGVHFDVGPPNDYRGFFTGIVADVNAADAYLISNGARGGELRPETACDPNSTVDHDDNPLTPDLEIDCQFPDYPGTVSWKTGFQLYKELLFDSNRKDMFRYAFYAHAKAAPKSLMPCEGASGPAGINLTTGDCLSGAPDPLFHVPAGVSGSGEFPGGDFLVTLGLWDNTKFVGSDFVVASTTMHELGHTLNLGHGGQPAPNCKPNYLSVMNYLFQLGGLIDSAGVPRLGYSEIPLLNLNETSLSDGYEIPGQFRTSWYAPLPAGDTRTPVKRFCNGLKFPAGTPQTIRVDGGFNAATLLPTPIDWNIDGDTNDSGLTQDINFDGEPDGQPGGPTTTLTGYDDWANLHLNQVGSRRNFSGISIGPLGVQLLSDGSKLLADGSVFLADGSRLLADGSVLLADGSRFLADGAVFLADGSVLLADGSVLLADGVRLLSDGARLLSDGSRLLADGSPLLADGARLLSDGSVLLADGSVLLADGSVFLADGSVLLADGVTLLADGSVLLADGSPLLADGATVAWEFAELTPTVAAEAGVVSGPNTLTACVIGEDTDCPGVPDEPLHRVWLDWEPPSSLTVAHYVVYRVEGDTAGPGDVGVSTEVPGSETSLLDTDELPDGVNFTYVVEAVLADGTVTPRSNTRTITAVNDQPTANNQNVVVNEDSSPTPITLVATDVDSASLTYTIVTSPTHGTLYGTPPNVTYRPHTNYFGADSFTFKANDKSVGCCTDPGRDSSVEAVSITVNPVNDVPSFTKGPNQTANQNAGLQTVVGWATLISPGPANSTPPTEAPDPIPSESGQVVDFIVTNNNNALFSVQPAVSSTGTLTYTPAAVASGVATVTVRIHDNGGLANGGVDTSAPQTFTITINGGVAATQIKFFRTDVWMSTSSANRKFDLKAEVLKNGVPVPGLEKIITKQVLGSGSTFNKAIYKQIGNFPTTLVNFATSDTLSIRVSIKVSNSSPGGSNASGDIRLWYNIPTPPGNNSHLHAKRNGVDVKYYMIAPFKLQKNGSVAGPTENIHEIVHKTGFTPLGTWSITGP
jgi:hypothetical protein